MGVRSIAFMCYREAVASGFSSHGIPEMLDYKNEEGKETCKYPGGKL